jgi:predicted dehydrogenase
MPRRAPSDRRSFLAATGSAAILGAATAADPPAKKIRVGVIGCGSVSGVYLPHLTKCPFVEVVSTCDIKPERAAKRATAFKVPNQYPSIEAMLAGAAFDLLVNLTDMQEHGRLNKLALAAGRHVWSEKPLANTYAEGKELVDLAKAKGVRIWGAPAMVNSPQFAFMATTARSGALGRLAAAHATYGHTGPGWSAFFYEKGGGSIPDLAVYNLTTITGVLGPAKAVTAMTSIVTPRRKVDDKGDIRVEAEDNAMILMDHGDGVLSHVQSGFNYFDPHGHEGGSGLATVTVYGSTGSMRLIGYDWAPEAVELATVSDPKPKRHATQTNGFVWQEGASHVAECLATGKEPKIAAEHALHVLEIWEATRTSQETGRRVPLRSTFKWPVAG